MPDYLSCGACHAEFDMVDFYRFLDHKVSNCGHGQYYGNNGSQQQQQQQLAYCSESILECSKCLKKCRTPWSLLQHLQAEHCLSLVRTLLLPSAGLPHQQQKQQPQQQQHQSHQSTDQQLGSASTSEACTQTMRSCLKRQVCPYEADLPDECCLKASQEQLASDAGCCCMDSYGVGGRSSGGGDGHGDANCVGCDSGASDRQTDCCLAVPKKRRLLPAAAADATGGASSAALGASSTGAANCDRVSMAKRQVRSAECQTDFVLNLLDLDVDMLLEDAAAAAPDDVPTSLVAVDVAPTEPAAAKRRPLPPAPSKAIQTVISQIAGEPPPPPAATAAAAATYYSYSTPAETLHYTQQQQQQQQPLLCPQSQSSVTLSLLAPSVQQAQASLLPAISLAPVTLPTLERPSLSGAATSLSVALVGRTVSSASVAGKEAAKFRCTQCSRSFRQKIHLRKHVMSQHSRSKPHKCPSCDYTTVEKSHLTVHIRKHTGERPFGCRICEYSTAQNCTLKAHYLRKHPGSVVHCGRCGQEFVTEHERDKHERSCCQELLPELAAGRLHGWP